MTDKGLLAFCPTERDPFSVTLDFVPADAPAWDMTQPGTGTLRVTDGEIVLLNFVAGENHPHFRLAYEDVLEAFLYLQDPDH